MGLTRNTIKSIQYAVDTRRTWWFIASSRSRERYSRAALGSLWIGISNLLSIGALGVVYGTVFKVKDFNEYIIFLGIGLSVWNTIALAIQSGPGLFKANASNIQNTNNNAIFYTLTEWAFQVQTFIQSFGLVVACLALIKPVILINLATSALIPIINLLVFIYWLPLLITLLGIKYEDFFQLIPVVLQLSFLLSPILYEKAALGKYQVIADINPLYQFLEVVRTSIINGQTSAKQLAILTGINTIMALISIMILESKRKNLPFYV